MLLYKDFITGDVLFSDDYPIKEVDGIAYEVDCAMISKDGDVDGATIVNVVQAFGLQPTGFVKDSYRAHLKEYGKALLAKLIATNPDRVKPFGKGAREFEQKILRNFKDYEFYTGESMNPDGMAVLLSYREDGETPYLTFWKDGVRESES